MKRIMILAMASVSLFAIAVVVSSSARAGVAKKPMVAYVDLQPSTPGSAQAGHLNVTGAVRAGAMGLGAAPSGAIVQVQSAASTIGVKSTTAGTAVNGLSTATTGATYGGYFQDNSSTGVGVRGFAASATGASFAGAFRNLSTSGVGVYAVAEATTGATYAGKFFNSSGTGTAVYGYASNNTGKNYAGYFVANGFGAGVFGQNTSGADGTAGGRFRVNGLLAIGVDSWNSAKSGLAYGTYSRTDSTNGDGVYALAAASTGTGRGGAFESFSPTGTGVLGNGANGNGGINYGVRGSTSSLANGYGVYSAGRFAATGTKSFRIDHPLDPENKFLNHYCAEGPEPLNVYRGTVVTDAQGFAWVQLPNYFAEINKDPSYQLTVVDSGSDFVLAKVTQKVVDNRFQIRTSKGHVEVCWEVKGVRNDRFVRAYGVPVEVNKTDTERGLYQHPELYGKPKEKGMFFRDSHESAASVNGTNVP